MTGPEDNSSQSSIFRQWVSKARDVFQGRKEPTKKPNYPTYKEAFKEWEVTQEDLGKAEVIDLNQEFLLFDPNTYIKKTPSFLRRIIKLRITPDIIIPLAVNSIYLSRTDKEGDAYIPSGYLTPFNPELGARIDSKLYEGERSKAPLNSDDRYSFLRVYSINNHLPRDLIQLHPNRIDDYIFTPVVKRVLTNLRFCPTFPGNIEDPENDFEMDIESKFQAISNPAALSNGTIEFDHFFPLYSVMPPGNGFDTGLPIAFPDKDENRELIKGVFQLESAKNNRMDSK